VSSPVQAQIWGLGRVAALEHPGRWGGLIDLPTVLDERVTAQLGAVLAGCGEDQVAIRPGALLARRLARVPSPSGHSWRPRGTVLVTGGTGAIGGRLARWLAQGGADRVVLASRSGPAAPGTGALAAGLAARGASVTMTACDVAERDQAGSLLAMIAATGPALTAVLHTAGVGQATPLEDTGLSELRSVLAAKATGAAWLDELTTALDLEQFVLFSSISATWGSGHQPAYAAANAFLDGLAASRRARGLPATSVAWGLWGGGGMGAGNSAEQLQQRGLRVMDPDLALQSLGQALAAGENLVTVADVDWARFAAAFTLVRPSPLLSDLPEVQAALSAAEAAADAEADSGARAELERRLAPLSPADQDRIILELVRAEAAAVLGLASPETVKPRQPFRELGFDSLTAVELRNRLTAATGQRLPPTLVFDYPAPATLAAYLRAEIVDDAPAATETVFAELDRLESAVSGLAADNEARADVVLRLRAVLTGLTGTGDAPEPAAVGSRLQAATADEVLTFIDKELGMS
jgi:short-subunit dehydrogenase/acyl carrier protein